MSHGRQASRALTLLRRVVTSAITGLSVVAVVWGILPYAPAPGAVQNARDDYPTRILERIHQGPKPRDTSFAVNGAVCVAGLSPSTIRVPGGLWRWTERPVVFWMVRTL